MRVRDVNVDGHTFPLLAGGFHNVENVLCGDRRFTPLTGEEKTRPDQGTGQFLQTDVHLPAGPPVVDNGDSEERETEQHDSESVERAM
jgi:hypothetical protein